MEQVDSGYVFVNCFGHLRRGAQVDVLPIILGKHLRKMRLLTHCP
jgi:hypothetical protein